VEFGGRPMGRATVSTLTIAWTGLVDSQKLNTAHRIANGDAPDYAARLAHNAAHAGQSPAPRPSSFDPWTLPNQDLGGHLIGCTVSSTQPARLSLGYMA
jgi:hypothetical protein